MNQTSSITGSVTLDHRLRQLAEQLFDQANHALRELDVDAELDHRWEPVYRALLENGPSTQEELGTAVAMDQPTLLHILRPMSEAGLVEVNRNRLEGNVRQLQLTQRAIDMAETLIPFWDRLCDVQRQLFRAAQCEVTTILDRVERGLAGESLKERLAREQAGVSSA
jgi:DNA-binding MarR family transcriptional regulator